MIETDWDLIDFFSPSENWGNPSLMNLSFVQLLDKYRDFIKTPITISCGTQGAHEEHSLHSVGCAVDILIPKKSLLDSWIDACRFDFTGIGFYPNWMEDNRVVGGLHLEKDPTKTIKKFWMGIGTAKYNTQYVAMSEDNLKVYYFDTLKNAV